MTSRPADLCPAAPRRIATVGSRSLSATTSVPTKPLQCIAKGYGEVAEQILKLAFQNDVKVRTDPDLAQILQVVEVDCEIPVQAFAAVAEILTYVYRMNGSLAGGGSDGTRP